MQTPSHPLTDRERAALDLIIRGLEILDPRKPIGRAPEPWPHTDRLQLVERSA